MYIYNICCIHVAESTYEFQKPDKIDHAFRYERFFFFFGSSFKPSLH